MAQQNSEELVVRVAEDQLLLPETSPTARSITKLLRLLVTMTGDAVKKLGQVAQSALVIERSEDEKRIVKASLIFPARSAEQVEQAKKLLDPNRSRIRRRMRDKNGDLVEPKPAKISPRKGAKPDYLKLNSIGLVEISDQPRCGEEFPRLTFRLIEEYDYTPTTGKNAGKTQKVSWEIDSTFLQGVIYSWLRQDELLDLPKEARQGAAREVALWLMSYLGLNNSGSQPYTSFASFDERRPEQFRRECREAILRLARRVTPFEKEKRRGELVIVDPDVQTLRRGPHPRRMTIRWVKSDAVIIRERQDGQLYAFLPIFDGLPENSSLWRFHQEDLFWWQERIKEFHTLPAWSGSKQAKLQGNEPLVCLPLAHQPRLKAWLEDETRQVCWTLLTERQVDGRSEFYLHVVTKKKVTPRLRTNLLTVLPTMKDGYSCFRFALLREGQIVQFRVMQVDRIPTGPPSRKRSWKRARWLKAVEAARRIADLADQFDANLALGLIDWIDKRKGDKTTNTLMTRFNYGDLIEAVENKALDRPDPVAIVARVSQYEREQVCGKEADQHAQICATAKLAWKKFVTSREKVVTVSV